MSYGTLLATLVVLGSAGMSAATAAADPVVPELRAVEGSDEERYVRYGDQCIKHIERYLNQHSPKSLQGATHRTLHLLLAILPDGTIKSVEVIRSSGNRRTDRAAVDIVKRASPLPPFPDEIRVTTDVFELGRGYTFSPDGKLTIER